MLGKRSNFYLILFCLVLYFSRIELLDATLARLSQLAQLFHSHQKEEAELALIIFMAFGFLIFRRSILVADRCLLSIYHTSSG